jgi:hypothetical protein
MPGPADHLSAAGDIVRVLRKLGLQPVLVGGMALVVLGSRRVTRDFDFLIAHPGTRLADTIAAFYARGFELVSRFDVTGDVTATIASEKVAAIRLRLDAPATASFLNPDTGLRIDLLFDFPIPAAEVLAHATPRTIGAFLFEIASDEDLLRLKSIARAARSSPGDEEDIAFLRSRRKRT